MELAERDGGIGYLAAAAAVSRFALRSGKDPPLWQGAEKYRRLIGLKRRYDPANLFRLN
jgi:hypothetical protein